MKKLALLVSFMSLLFFGCASKDYVKQQTDPLVDRISRLEAQKDCCKTAEAAAEMANNAAKKCEKAFELHQEK
jgi:hypothetical protein